MCQPGRNWPQAELIALKKRLVKVTDRENDLNQRTFVKRNTQRYTEMSSVGGEDIMLSDLDDDAFSSEKTSKRQSEIDYQERRITGDSGTCLKLLKFNHCTIQKL